MNLIDFLILAALAWVLFASPSWPWGARLGPYPGFAGIFVLTCLILWSIFGAGHGGCAVNLRN